MKSMFVTKSHLEKYEGCGAGVNYFNKHYPNGAEVLELINDPNIELEFLHWGKKYLSVSQEELDAYRKRCHIDENSRFTWFSEDIENSTAISKSRRIKDSKNINDCEDIDDCLNIFNSKRVAHSMEVSNCEDVSDSTKIIDSNKIEASNQILNSENIEWSSFITFSKQISESSFIYKSENVQNSDFCGFLKNCNHCLFCNGLNDMEYYIFNRKVEPTLYEEWFEKLQFQLQRENPSIIETTKDLDAQTHFKVNRRLDAIFSKLSPDFYGWIGTIPHFNEEIFITLFFRDWKKKFEKIINI